MIEFELDVDSLEEAPFYRAMLLSKARQYVCICMCVRIFSGAPKSPLCSILSHTACVHEGKQSGANTGILMHILASLSAELMCCGKGTVSIMDPAAICFTR